MKNISNIKRKIANNYWMEKITAIKDFITDLKAGRVEDTYDSVEFDIGPAITNRISQVASNNVMNQYVIFLSFFGILLYKYYNYTEFPVASPGIIPLGEDEASEFFLFYKIEINHNYSIKKVLQDTRKEFEESLRHKDYNYEQIKLLLDKNGTEMHHLKNFGFFDYRVNYNKELSIFEQVQLQLRIEEIAGEKNLFRIKFNESSFNKNFIQQLVSHYQNLLSYVHANLDETVERVEILSQDEKQQLLFKFNQANGAYPKHKTIPELFLKGVAEKPDYTALYGHLTVQPNESGYVTYRELNEKSDHLQLLLEEKGILSETIVGIMLERNIEMVISILAILKAGGVYLPIDPYSPSDRLRLILEDSQAEVIITQNCFLEKLNHYEVINLQSAGCFSCKTGSVNRAKIKGQPMDLAYVLYTSGSTGQPKGVLVQHQHVVNLVYSLKERIYDRYQGQLNVSIVAPFIFDASVQQVFASLLLLHTLHIIPGDTRADGNRLLEFYCRHQIDVTDGTPAHLQMILEYIHEKSSTSNLKNFIIGGEALPHKLARQFLLAFQPQMPTITNIYGPAECCVDCTSYALTLGNIDSHNAIPIGKSMLNRSIYLLNPDNQLEPIGIPGELCIGGEGIGRGYLNNTELTIKKFVKNPFLPGERMYRTGDLAKWLPDGNIEFLGRIDQQVKIRGYRIELGEIENQLLKHQAVKEVVVIVKQEHDGDKYLCAYIVTKKIDEKKLTIEGKELKEFLAASLPDYMIPSYFVSLDRIPITTTGKVDRKNLPEPLMKETQKYIAPRDEIEKTLAAIWIEVLKLKRPGSELNDATVGIDDDFFQLGGHSLKATVMAAKIHKELQVKVPLAQIFNTPTIREINQYIKNAKKSSYISIPPVEKMEYYPTSSAQKRLYILQQINTESTVYNMPFVIPLGSQLDQKRLEDSFKKLIARHEALRTSFEIIDEKPVQKIHADVEFAIRQHQVINDAELNEIGEHFVKPFDLSQAPLLRAALIKKTQENSAQLLAIDLHHIITDGVSQNTLAKEFISLYRGEELPPLPLHYKDYSWWQQEVKNDDFRKLESYWLKKFAGEIPLLNMPTDYPRLAVRSFEGDMVNFDLNVETTKDLIEMAQSRGATLFMVLLALYSVFLSKMSGQEDIIIGTPVAGRNHAELEQVIGIFINMVALRNHPYGENSFDEFLKNLKQQTLEAFENQEYQFEDLVEKTGVTRDISRSPLFDVIFVIQDVFESASEQETDDTESSELKVNPYILPYKTARYDLSLNVIERGKKLYFNLEYSTQLFKYNTIVRFIDYFKRLIKLIIKNPAKKLAEIEIISEEEKERLVFEFNRTTSGYPHDKTIHELFEEKAKQNPRHTAVSIDLDLTGIYNSLQSESDTHDSYEKLANCCFKRNPYLFQYEDKCFLKALHMFDEQELLDLVLLRTQRDNFIAVNEHLLLLLEYFTGQFNLKSLLEPIADTQVEYKIYPLEIDLEIGRLERKAIRFIFDGDDIFEKLVLFIKVLYSSNLIELTGYHSTFTSFQEIEALKRSMSQGKNHFDAGIPLENLPLTDADATGVPKKEPVLLMGDRASTATTGLLYIASYLRRHGIEVYCQWNNLDKTRAQLKESLIQKLAKIKPKIVGVSLKWFPHIARVLEICKIIKQYDASIQVVIGGNTASYFSENLIQYEWIDRIVLGDGEIPFLKICNCEEYIPNCVYKKNGEIVATPITYVQDKNNSSDIFLSHLDQIFISDLDPYLPSSFYINTGKGCSQQCFYCGGGRDAQAKIFNRPKPFLRGIHEVRKDIIEAKKYTSQFMFDFDLPMYDSQDYYREIWKDIDLSGHFCRFYFGQLPPEEFIELVVKTFKYVYINIDICSLSERHRMELNSLGLVKPQPTDAELFEFFKRCEKYNNVDIIINHITGLPHFTYEDIKISNEIISKLMTDYSKLKEMDWGRLHPQPGAPIIENCESFAMPSFARTFADFLHYSELNLNEERYPELFTYNYPYIYSVDEKLNAQITNFYAEIDTKIKEYKKQARRQARITLRMSYEELSKKSDRLAYILRKKGVLPGTTAAIAVEPCLELIIGLLAILKAGANYLPVDLKYPGERVKHILKDTNAAILITRGNSADKYRALQFQGQVIDILDEKIYSEELQLIPPIDKLSRPDIPAYVIYTSGSTGKPRGVVITHQNVVRLALGSNLIDFKPGDKLLLTGSIAFDITTFEIWGSLLNGITLYLTNQNNILAADQLRKIIVRNEITILHLIPQLFNQLTEQCPGLLGGLRYFLVGGDLLRPHYVNKVRHLYGTKDIKILHMYGPTENTTFSTFFPLDMNIESDLAIPIGKSVGNSSAYIVDKYGQLVPIGVSGELLVGGDGIAMGYLNHPEMTNDKFLRTTYTNNLKEEEKKSAGPKKNMYTYLYKTGDRARWLQDGNIEFLGRMDFQVKIRGIRVEIGEIESLLLTHKNIKEVVVIEKVTGSTAADAADDKHLIAYIVLKNKKNSRAGQTSDSQELREYLSQSLPTYMIPSFFVFLDKIPLTANGKVDRKSLPDNEITGGIIYASPRNEVEEKLVNLWGEILNIKTRNDSLQPHIGIDDDFFNLGGHSLKISIMTAKINKEFYVKISITEVFRNPTIRKLAQLIGAKGGINHRIISIKPVEKREYYELSSAQRRLYILQQLDLENTGYNIPQVIRLKTEPDLEFLQATLRQLIKRHDSLRTSFMMIEKGPVQKIHDDIEFKVEYNAQHTLSDGEIAVRKFIRPFDLGQAPLFRFHLIKLAESEYILMMDIHHIIIDATSWKIFLKEFSQISRGDQLPPLELQYQDYSEWQNSDKHKEILEPQEKYWLQQFKGELPVLDLPTDYPRPAVQSFEGRRLVSHIGRNETIGLKSLAYRQGATLYMVMLAIYNIFLSKICSQEDIIIGSPVLGRQHAALNNIIGIFINTLALRNQPGADKSFIQFLEEVKITTLNALENQLYPFEDLVDKLSLNRDISRNPLFDVLLNYQAADKGARDKTEEMLGIYDYETRTSQFDFTLYINDTGDTLYYAFEYCTKLFTVSAIERFTCFFKRIAEIVVQSNGSWKLSGIEITSEAEKRRILYDFNDTNIQYPGGQTFHELFAHQVEKTPGNIAVIGSNLFLNMVSHVPWTYGELNKRSNQLAEFLKLKGVKPGVIVGVMVERSIDMIVAILGIIKAGGAYLPMDPIYPPERIKYMLADSRAFLVIVSRTMANIVENTCELLEIEEIYSFEETNPVINNNSAFTDPVYVIYTSGSTGRPKGVMIEHCALVNFINGMTDIIDFTPDDNVLALTTLSFDISGLEILLPLTKGSRVVIGTQEEQVNAEITALAMSKQNITILQVTPSGLSMFLANGSCITQFNRLRYLLVGGEAFPVTLLERARQVTGGKIYNVYGPTETTIWSTIKDVSHGEILNIGKPIANTFIHILDRNGKIQPPGIRGELCIGGLGLARGYINKVHLTWEKFRPAIHKPGKYMYHTGDIARWTSEGDIEFLGRQDEQVKIRGFRIELGEIEKQLSTHVGIKKAVVTCRNDAEEDKYLCAYIEAPPGVDVEALRENLSHTLPHYMIPSYFVTLGEIPLTPNGKIDWKALPAPHIDTGEGYRAPTNEIQKKMVEIWSQLLDTRNGNITIGIDDNFFRLGGHSLKATSLVERVYKELNIRLPLAEIFKTPTIRVLSEKVSQLKKLQYVNIFPAEKREYYPLAPAQRRLYILNQMDKTNTRYNMPMVLIINGQLNKFKFEETHKQLIERNEILRTSFIILENEPVQVVHQEVDFKIEYNQAAEDQTQSIVKAFFRPFNLDQAPLLRIGLIKIHEARHIWMVDMHHIVADGASSYLLQMQFRALYNENHLPPLKLHYKDFSQWQNQLLAGGEIEKQETYWLDRFKGEIPRLNLPFDYTVSTTQRLEEGEIVRSQLEEWLTVRLYETANKTGATIYMILLAVFNVLLAKYTKQEDIIIGSPIAGRRHIELETMIGMFVNMLAMRNFPREHKTFSQFLQEVKQNALDAYDNQDYQFEDLVRKLEIVEYTRNPLCNVVFVLQNANEQMNNSFDLKIEPYPFVNRTVKFDLQLEVIESPGIITLLLNYPTALFKRSSAETIILHYLEILEHVIENIEMTLKDITVSHTLAVANTNIFQEENISFGF